MKYLKLILVTLFAAGVAWAGPGAHGPNGEHLDGAASNGSTSTLPRFETFTESYELVGQLSGGELSILIDRYETNEPLLNGDLEVQYKDIKAKARFHADLGDYAVDDARLLKAISQPGTHPLLMTLVAGDESDLLEGTLIVNPPAHDDHPSTWRRWLAGLAAAVLLAATFVVYRRRKQGKLK